MVPQVRSGPYLGTDSIGFTETALKFDKNNFLMNPSLELRILKYFFVSLVLGNFKHVCHCREKLPPNLRGSILCGGVKMGDGYAFQHVNNTLHKATSVQDQHLYSMALTCTNDTQLLKR